MKFQLSGFGFLLAYILMVGVASFLEKFSMKQINPYQVNFLMAIGMAVGSLAFPSHHTGFPAYIIVRQDNLFAGLRLG